jgi:hypothetical protein
MKYIALIPLLFVVSCASQRPPQLIVRPLLAPAVDPTDAVRYAEVIRSYHVGRYVDPNHPALMHEQHPVYRVEASTRWNLRPGSSSFANSFNPPPDAAFVPPPTNDVVLAELSRQRDATERVIREAVQLARSYGELQQVIKDMTEVAKNHTWMRARLVNVEQRFAGIEKELRRLAEAPSTATNEAPAFSTEPQKP